jgi:hypothetical protein
LEFGIAEYGLVVWGETQKNVFLNWG